jgi:RimJ/RimL family protein N-acetyltransferase
MIRIDNNYHLDEFRLGDTASLVDAINDAEISRNTLNIPFPYTQKDAEWWLTEMGIRKNLNQPQKNWAIRNTDGLICGGIGLHHKYGADSHKDEIGYWLKRDLWGQGIMTKVVGEFTSYCFDRLNLERLEAPIFEFNKGSARVLENNGYQREGLLRKAYLKEGTYYNSVLFARVAD